MASGTVSTSVNAAEFSTIFVGSSVDLQDIDPAAISAPLFSDGDVGLYAHMSGLVNAYVARIEAPILSTWINTGPGLTETTQYEPMAIMSVTIGNSGSAPIIVPIGTIVSSANGIQYQIVQKPRQEAGWSNTATGSGSSGYYTVLPGQTVEMTAQALLDGPSGDLQDNQITQVAVAGARVVSSTLDIAAQGWGVGTITVANTGSAPQFLYTSQQVFGSGGAYNVGINTSVKGFVATDGDQSSGYYIIQPGQAITVPIGSSQDISAATPAASAALMAAAAAPAGSITGSNFWSGLVVTSSSAITIQGITNPSDQDRLTQFGDTGFLTDSAEGLWTSWQGYSPSEANVNTTNYYIWNQEDLTNWEALVDNYRSMGIINLAPMVSEFETVDFATAAATQDVRAGILYSGGLSFDMPPWFFLVREPAYQNSTYSEIKWATENGLRSSITLSPIGPNDENFLAQTKQMVAMLEANNALPTQFVVKDGGVTGSAVLFDTSDPNSLNNVANYLASIVLTPSNSESMLETHGSSGTNRVDDIMTGVQDSETVSGPASSSPFSIAQFFAESKSNVATVTITIANPGFGRLINHTAMGKLLSDGAAYSVTGTMSEITSAVQMLSFVAASGITGNTSLTVSVSDAAGVITGKTNLSISNATPVDPGYLLNSAARIYTLVSDPGKTAVITPSGTDAVTVQGGQASLVFTGGHALVDESLGPVSQSVTVDSTGGVVLDTGAGPVSFLASGSNVINVGAVGQTSGTVNVEDGGAFDSLVMASKGNAAAPETIINASSAPTTVFGGVAILTYTGMNSVVVDNGAPQTGQLAIHSTGNDIVWAGLARTDLYVSSGNDTLIGGSGLAVVHGSSSSTAGTTTIVSNHSTGFLEYDGGTDKAVISIGDASAVVFAGPSLESMTLSGLGNLLAVSPLTSTGEQDIVASASSKGVLAYWGGGDSANLNLGGTTAFVSAGAGNTTLVGGSGNLDLVLVNARSTEVKIDGATGGNASIYGFDPKTASLAFSDVRDVQQQLSGLVVDLQDGHSVTFFGTYSHAGLTFG